VAGVRLGTLSKAEPDAVSRYQSFTLDISSYERRPIADEFECLGGVWRNWLAHWVVVGGLRVHLRTDVFLHPNTALERAAYGHVHSKGLLCQSLRIETYQESRLLGLLPRFTSMVHQEEGIYGESSRDEKGKMHSPPNRTAAKDLLLHMADESNIIMEIEVCKSRA